MRISAFCLLCCFVCLSSLTSAEAPAYRDVYPDTWVATDAVGRTMPDQSTTGPVKNDQRRVVGMFYITWHRDQQHDLNVPYSADVTKILEADPKAFTDAKHPLWTAGSYHWGEPEMGYFLSEDEYVIRKDISMLSDAGVDVLILDVTNAVRYWDEWAVLLPAMQKMKAAGNKVPKFCFWAFNGPTITVVQDLYERIYETEQYKDLWFYWDGKPLLLYNDAPNVNANRGGVKHPNLHYDPAAKNDPSHPHFEDPAYTEEFYTDYSQEVKDFFTVRGMWWGYYEWAGGRYVGGEDRWSFGYDMGDGRVRNLDPEKLISTHKGKKEEAAVTPAQHATTMIGKSWTREHGEPKLNEYALPVPTYVPWLGKTVENPEAYGIYFQDRWDETLPYDPQFIYINDWNEWTAGKYHHADDATRPFLGQQNNYFFVDQYNSEFTRCIQPMKDGYTDNYYMQMAQNIRKYKGVRPIPQLKGTSEIAIDGVFEDWESIKTEYRDTVGDTFHRDYPGYGGLHYKDDSGRNDIITSKVAVDATNIHFLVQTKDALTPHTDASWMFLLIDSDNNIDTGWYGYDFLVNKDVVDEKLTTLKRYDKVAASWQDQGQLSYHYAGDSLELSIPRELMGVTGDAFTLNFHWADNPPELETPISLCTKGDSAPNRRFNYRCIWKK